MRFIKFTLLLITAFITFVIVGCSVPIDRPFTDAVQSDLVSRYDLNFSSYIWNDYQPIVAHPPRSTHFVAINTSQAFDLNQVKMSVQIVTSRTNITRDFTLRTYGGGSPFGDFRSTEIFRLNDNQSYTLHISILYGRYTQTITLTGRVFVTH